MPPITASNITRHELIGLTVKVSGSLCPSHIGIAGKIVDETRNTLIIASGKKVRKVPKDTTDFQLDLPNGSIVEVKGSQLVGRPEDRVKKAVRRRW